jgi:hypothetical protein
VISFLIRDWNIMFWNVKKESDFENGFNGDRKRACWGMLYKQETPAPYDGAGVMHEFNSESLL